MASFPPSGLPFRSLVPGNLCIAPVGQPVALFRDAFALVLRTFSFSRRAFTRAARDLASLRAFVAVSAGLLVGRFGFRAQVVAGVMDEICGGLVKIRSGLVLVRVCLVDR